jgi:FRG domain
MKVHDLDTWQEFKQAVNKLRSDYERLRTTHSVSLPTFRGQASSTWRLETTLERAHHPTMKIGDYGALMAKIAPEICTNTNRRFEVPGPIEWEYWLKKIDDEQYFAPGSLPGYEFMVYLRHQGFPSPLLDWTDSEFVAAYFAFADTKSDEKDARVAIYAYMEYGGSYKVGSVRMPAISGMGPYVMSHPRHFTQQARYTYCKKLDEGGSWTYVPHSLVFESDPKSLVDAQDVLIQYTLPASERDVVLRELMRFNLTAYSLFATEEALMKTMAFKVL